MNRLTGQSLLRSSPFPSSSYSSFSFCSSPSLRSLHFSVRYSLHQSFTELFFLVTRSPRAIQSNGISSDDETFYPLPTRQVIAVKSMCSVTNHWTSVSYQGFTQSYADNHHPSSYICSLTENQVLL